MTHNLILIGNPNTGKTTLFNTMTNSNEKASNWHGVTVAVKKKKYKYKNHEFSIADVPGVYSLKGYSNEEKIAIDYLCKHKDDIVINICDANNIKRNLALTCELINKGFKVLVVVNMNNETSICNYEKLEKEIGAKIIAVDARKKSDASIINNYLLNYANNYKAQISTTKSVKHEIIIKKSSIFHNKDPYKASDKIDKILLNKYLFLPIFLAIIFLIFYITFGDIGEIVCDIINIVLNKIAILIKNSIKLINLPQFIQNFICEAIVDGTCSILGFLPQIIMLIFFINIIEDTGLMSRFSFMFDDLLKNVGLTGKSLFSLFMGFGCSTSAIVTTRNLESNRLRKLTVSSISFLPCSAKLPVFLVIASLFFENYKYLIVFALYIFSIIISVFAAFIINKKSPYQESYFILEMPKIRGLNFKKVCMDVFATVSDFFKKITKMILIFSVILWILQNTSISFECLNGENFEKSMLYLIASKVSFLFRPIGLDNVGVVVALLLGLCAKELVVVGLYMINGVSGGLSALTSSLLSASSICYFDSTSSIVFLIFVLLYSPCISALAAIKSEINKKYVVKLFAIQMALAYLVSFIVYMCLNEINFIYLILAILLVVLLIKFMIQFSRKEKFNCQGMCNACRNNHCRWKPEGKLANIKTISRDII